MVDSDDELLPGALARLRELIAELPPGCGCCAAASSTTTATSPPASSPTAPTATRAASAGPRPRAATTPPAAWQRAVFADTPYIDGRRGAMETLFELNLAERETSVCVEEVTTKVHADAPDSWLRAAGAADVVPRLQREAADMLWMAEDDAARHGEALQRWGPRQYVTVLRIGATQAFILGKRRLGARYSLRALRRKPFAPAAWITLLLGLLGPGATARGAVAYRRIAA